MYSYDHRHSPAGSRLRLKELAMPDLDQIEQAEQGARDRRGRFSKGRRANPTGRPCGCRDHVNRAARLLPAGEGEAPTRKAVDLALAASRGTCGNPAAFPALGGSIASRSLSLGGATRRSVGSQ
jgi:hypothetical protein